MKYYLKLSNGAFACGSDSLHILKRRVEISYSNAISMMPKDAKKPTISEHYAGAAVVRVEEIKTAAMLFNNN